MKSLLLSALALASISSAAYQDGTYNCGSKATYLEFTYKISTVTSNGISMPHLDITKKYYKKPSDPNSVDKTYNIQGFATVFKTDAGDETLVLGNLAIDTTTGRPSCAQ
ncbi:hypothetical protein K2P97_09850 [bacterium]|nr:hypothetical protein [bacterium]